MGDQARAPAMAVGCLSRRRVAMCRRGSLLRRDAHETARRHPSINTNQRPPGDLVGGRVPTVGWHEPCKNPPQTAAGFRRGLEPRTNRPSPLHLPFPLPLGYLLPTVAAVFIPLFGLRTVNACHNVPSAARQPPGPISTRAIPQEQKRPSVSDSSAPQPLRDLVDTPTPQPMEKDKPASATSRNPSIGPLGNVSVSAGCGLMLTLKLGRRRWHHATSWGGVGQHTSAASRSRPQAHAHTQSEQRPCVSKDENPRHATTPRARGEFTQGTGRTDAHSVPARRVQGMDQLGKHPPLRALPPFHGVGHNGRERRLGLMSSRL
ncbi:hypothetical protein PCL_08665 [Purpureocillium lilacinum]|uniref:Uncharacterized protein n=1 Tax=Purpureocillium lilacinum TaxID=33203 RepID=A0A2U3DR13_PURLI|nr:hypothetical protein PCL_08665 [Purpureocillium lilacinum]